MSEKMLLKEESDSAKQFLARQASERVSHVAIYTSPLCVRRPAAYPAPSNNQHRLARHLWPRISLANMGGKWSLLVLHARISRACRSHNEGCDVTCKAAIVPLAKSEIKRWTKISLRHAPSWKSKIYVQDGGMAVSYMTPRLVLAVAMSLIGSSIPGGYCLGVINTPQELPKRSSRLANDASRLGDVT
ncbi:hypothetical protein GWK47_010865 [Chionoecetes opilio]|uniref:Uncharacterized protein n=1 Tax=Chionoecetes opilio TaxID=41210 RepID=A0A8J4Y440_CHIOP|nr:hypothetical protein GWK47_010865 [Chionoecetes opilio]